MLGKHPFRRFAALSLACFVLFGGFVAYLWHDSDEYWWEWNWEQQDATIVGSAAGIPITTAEQFRDYAQGFDFGWSGAATKVIPLLQHASPAVRAAVSRILNRARGLGPAELPALIAAHQQGSPVLPAIASIGTAEAVAYVAAALQKDGDWSALARILTTAEPAGIQHLANIYRSPQPVAPELHRSLCDLVHHTAYPAAPLPWLEAVSSNECPLPNRVAALEILALMGNNASAVVPMLHELAADSSSPIAAAARAAAARIEGGATLARVLPDLQYELGEENQTFRLSRSLEAVATLGPEGQTAGPLVLPLLDSPDWFLRIGAAKALGRIGYTDAIPALTAALENTDDWVLAGAAAEALARLGAKDAIPALQRVASNHWFPPVRAQSAESLRVLSGEATFTEFERPPMYFGWSGDLALDRHVWEFSQHPLERSAALRVAHRFSCLIGNTWDRAWLWRAYRVAKSADARLGKPTYGQSFGAGYLLGYDNGEWGGEIIYVVAGKTAGRFPTGNVRGFYPMPFGLVAVTSHLNSGEGMLYLITPGPDGSITCAPFKRLPFELDWSTHFAPVTRRWNRELLIIGADSRSVILTRSGNLRMTD